MTLNNRGQFTTTLALGTNLASLTLAPEEENLEEMHYVMVHVERIKKHMLGRIEGGNSGMELLKDKEEIKLFEPISQALI